MRTKYRIESVFSLDGLTGQPQLNYMLQKRVWGKWENVQMFVTMRQAEEAKKFLESGR